MPVLWYFWNSPRIVPRRRERPRVLVLFFHILFSKGRGVRAHTKGAIQHRTVCFRLVSAAHAVFIGVDCSIRGNATGRVLADTGAFLKDIDKFDFLEFGITAKDARLMPLSCRKLIEVAFLGLQDSGVDYRGKNVGCYMSGVSQDFHAVSGHVRHCPCCTLATSFMPRSRLRHCHIGRHRGQRLFCISARCHGQSSLVPSRPSWPIHPSRYFL